MAKRKITEQKTPQRNPDGESKLKIALRGEGISSYEEGACENEKDEEK